MPLGYFTRRFIKTRLYTLPCLVSGSHEYITGTNCDSGNYWPLTRMELEEYHIGYDVPFRSDIQYNIHCFSGRINSHLEGNGAISQILSELQLDYRLQ